MELLFWGSTLFIGYVFIGYPLLLRLFCRLRGRTPLPVGSGPGGARRWPGVSIVLAARNEAARLAPRLDNLLDLNYPGPREILVVSDGSTDETDAVLARYATRIHAIRLPPGGKAAALNAGVERARHEVIVFADARQMFGAETLVELVRPLVDDARIGGVTGELLLDCESHERRRLDRRAAAATPGGPERRAGGDRRTLESTIAEGIGLYWRYEKAIRRLESAAGSTLGATGAVYALRRSVWAPLPVQTVLDDVLAPMRAVLEGRRVVFNDRARAFDRAAPDSETERQRKVRTLAGNFQILWLEPRLLLPWRNPVWLQYVSHKLGRLVVPYALLLVMAASIALARRSLWYAAALAVQCAFYALAGYGAWLDAHAAQSERRALPKSAAVINAS